MSVVITENFDSLAQVPIRILQLDGQIFKLVVAVCIIHVRYSTPHYMPKHPGNSEGRTEGLEQEGKRILRPCTSTAS
ncbi:uncharacterized protein BT62DRAFT_376597 [Guyanagaster necrorhizus]|uniref:Uncharacterized protein n=1 Tax=Guyanagaster necrorhizus TaxID=856835 RepID=A0A9P8AP49_9AGAR|nr:uncharacterized protein BT62DRAFT_376597 [Guyanagaster necrorhizus MCA 3950]KAG7442580.1 hypothetical protein BT62DRAFT_376597 [Guyanagaster necrorhizus MCA 3950]